MDERFTNVIAALVVSLLPAPARAAKLTPTTAESSALVALGARLPAAKLLWVRGGKTYYSTVRPFKPRLVTVGNIQETNPRWSPDGREILTVRSDGVWVMNADFSGPAKVIPGGNTASWTRDGKSITAVDASGYKVVRYDLTSKATTTIYDARQPPYKGQKVSQVAELRRGGRFLLVFRLTPSHTTEIVDLQAKTYISNQEMRRGDCSPAWAPDGSYIMNTARTGSRPVLKATFDAATPAISPSKLFVKLATSNKFYIHGQRLSNDGRWVVFGGKIFSGPKAKGAREIYIWRVGEPSTSAVRVTFDSDEDASPSLFVPPVGSTPQIALSPTNLSFAGVAGKTAPPSKKVAVSNVAGATLPRVTTAIRYAGGSSGWLAVKASGSGNRQSLDNVVKLSALVANTYAATVKVSAAGASNSPQSYVVTLAVKAAAPDGGIGDAGIGDGGGEPRIALSPSVLQFNAVAGGANPAGRRVSVSNAGAGTLGAVSAKIAYGNGSGWLTVKASGSGNAQKLDNRLATAGLVPDIYSATVSVNEPAAGNSPQSYVVTLAVAPGPSDSGVFLDGGAPSPDGSAAPIGADGAGGAPRDGGGAGALAGALEGGCSVASSFEATPLLSLLLLLLGGWWWRRAGHFMGSKGSSPVLHRRARHLVLARLTRAGFRSTRP